MEGKCVTYEKFGSPEQVLRIEHKSIRRPGIGELLVRMTSRPINPSDLIPVGGAYAHRIGLPAIPGYEGVGIVEETGPTVSRNWLGKRVLPLRGEGTWQQFVNAPAELAVLLPDTLDDDTASQLYINPVTAWVTCTEVLQLKPDDVVVVNACGSSIGRIYTQLSRILGFRLVAVTRSRSHTAELLEHGAVAVIQTDDPLNPLLHSTVMQLTNGVGANAAIDSVGGASGMALAYSARPGGKLLSIGLLSGKPLQAAEIAQKTGAKLMLFHLRHWNKQVSAETWQRTFRQLMSFIGSGQLRLCAPSARFDLSDVKEAVRAAQSTEKGNGKIFLTG
ncbi:zinc-dependent alcohol dehydrogenase family protein [Paenibacillus allorhizosphaerae]|uniref:Phthiocerol synthesis polyketide synthase type I PpsC n=1 Tax=Paenibacillus allorhizosphaerae TaxID=2849866 RepID=A0ABM8VB32_9BACL|nr:zinc-dependent alcohol dehydrogenase family protein [Paenibacillus allorhizosphaerae]CAG7618294.1 Phthiocerol synthesis polyketide synthase type I PpsC [Paenibacillus allorhizosphaerae]